MKWNTKPHWYFEDDEWLNIRAKNFDSSIRILAANQLFVPDTCMHEAQGLLHTLFGASDPDALGGRKAVSTLYSILAQFGSPNPETLIILKATFRPIHVMGKKNSQQGMVRTVGAPGVIEATTPQLKLYGAGTDLVMPGKRLGLRNDPMNFWYPDSRVKTPKTVTMSAQAVSPEGRVLYTDHERAVMLYPDDYKLFAQCGSASITANMPNLNIIQLIPRPGLPGRYTSVRFAICFNWEGTHVTGMCNKWSDFTKFLDVYPGVLRDALKPLLGV